jgi:hypothetical protein
MNNHKCKFCGDTNPDHFYGRIKSWCKKCHNKNTVAKKRNWKVEVIELMGGKCVKCGYDKCVAALEFHHPDPTKKDQENWRAIRNRGKDYLREQTKECIILCSNCHKELHYSEIPCPEQLVIHNDN